MHSMLLRRKALVRTFQLWQTTASALPHGRGVVWRRVGSTDKRGQRSRVGITAVKRSGDPNPIETDSPSVRRLVG